MLISDINFSIFANDSIALLTELGFTKIDLMVLNNLKVAENEFELSLCRFGKRINGLFISILKINSDDEIIYDITILSNTVTNFESESIEQLMESGVMNLKHFICR